MNFNYCPKCGKKGAIEQKGTSTYICSACDWRFWNNPKTSVTTLMVKGDRIMVAVRASDYSRKDLDGMLQFGGGFVNYNEGAHDAARREVQEEMGVEVTELALLDLWHREYDTDNMPPISVVDCVFVATDWKGTPEPSDDISALEWHPLEVVEDPRQAFKYPGILKKLQDFLAKRA